MTGYNGLERKFLTNTALWNDGSHGAHRDFDRLLVSNKHKGFWWLNIISMNFVHGAPMEDKKRLNDIKAFMANIYKHFRDPRQVPLFMAHVSMIIEDFRRLGVV